MVYEFKGHISTSASGYKQLISFYHRASSLKDEVVHLNFYSLRWIDGNLCAILLAIMYKLHTENGIRFSTDITYLEEKFPVLFKNGFLKFFKQLPDEHRTCIELRDFRYEEDAQEFRKYIVNDLVGNQAMSELEQSTKDRIIDNLMEIYSNVEHSMTTSPIFVCGQYYPTKNELKFTLIDLGVGYLEPIRRVDEIITTHSQAVLWSIKPGNTSRGNRIGGNGLSDILEYLNENGGRMDIVSGDSYWSSKNGKSMNINIDEPFCGSSISLVFDFN